MRLSFRGRIFGASILVVLCTMAFVAAYLHRSLRDQMISQSGQALQKDIILLHEMIPDGWSPDEPTVKTDSLADFLGAKLGLRVSIISTDGIVLGDSMVSLPDLAKLENHAHRPEIIEAVDKKIGWGLRQSGTVGLDLLYVAATLRSKTDRPFILRIAMPLSDLDQNLTRVRKMVFWASLLGVALSLGVAFFLSIQVFRPVKELTRVAAAISSGDLTQRLRRYPNHEIGELGRAFDRMTDHLQKEIEEVTRARDRLEAILRGMVEGVLVTDGSERITLVNSALKRMLDIRTPPLGLMPYEIIRNADLMDALKAVNVGGGAVSLEIRVFNPKPRTLQVEAAALPGEGRRFGVVAVFHDISERKRVEEMRKDFVANVSHELRTPLAAVKGAVETLMDGALDNPKFSRKFIEIIDRHVERLENIVLDLLELARLESKELQEKGELVSIPSLIESAMEAVSELAEKKNVVMKADLSGEEVQILGERRRLEQAVVNLLENAVKYTGPAGRVGLKCSVTNGKVEIAISDTGVGISSEHLPRIFERFYRVDKDRSRDAGGTGLGLSIVKHVAQAHGGEVKVESFPGKGSVFTIILPAAPPRSASS
ncbi:MAG: ATP-binding protein [Pseudomonadota bacterium]